MCHANEDSAVKQLIRYITFLTLFNGLVIDNDSFGQPPRTDTIFLSLIDRKQFDTLKGEDFTWEIFQPINDTLSYTAFAERPAFIQNLSSKQKVLFYTWELDRAVTGGSGFANFYYNYKRYYPEIIKGLTVLNDTAMLSLLKNVNNIYVSKAKKLQRKYKRGKWQYIEELFSSFDNAYLNRRDKTMELLEKYIRRYADEFVRFK